MAGQNRKLIGQLSLGLDTLRTNIKEANKIIEGISTKKLNLELIDDKTKTKSLDAIKLIKKEIEGMTKIGLDTGNIKSSIDVLLKSLDSVNIKTNVITQTFKANAQDAQEWAKKNVQAATTVEQSYNKLGQVIKAKTQLAIDSSTGLAIQGSQKVPTTTIVTDEASAKLTKIATAYQRLALEGKTTVQSLMGMANEVQKTTDKYDLQQTALKGANTQQLKYVNEASKITQTQVQQAQATESANAKITAQAVKLAQATEKQGLAELKLYTQEKSQTAQYSQMYTQIAKISGESKLAMSSSNSGNDMLSRFQISAAYTVATSSIYMLRQAVVSLIQTNRDFEAGLVDLGRILGNLSENEMADFGKQAIAIAKAFGEPLKEVQAAYSALAAAGVQNKNDLNSMAKTVTMGLNTSTIKSASEMTDLLTSSMKQMNISFSESESVLDKWNYLGDKSIATTADFAMAISKAGATSASLGIDLDHLNGMVAVLSNSTGASGTQIGDALKSIESRLLRPETLDVLKKYGIETMKDATHFKDFGSIITDVSTQLDKFGENTIQSTEILDALGGNITIYLKSYIWLYMSF